MRRRRAVSEDNRQDNASDQRSDSDMKSFTDTSLCQELARTCVDQTSLSVKAREHSDITATLKHKKKKRLRDANQKKSDVVVTSKKAKISKSNNDAVVQTTENVRHAKHKKHGANVEDSGRKRKKRKVHYDDNKVEADVLSWKSEFDSLKEKLANTTDSVGIPSTSSANDLQRLEDSVVDDYVSVIVIKL